MTIKRLSETLTFNDDDKHAIALMKKLGVWQKMKSLSVIGGSNKTCHIGNYVFQWHANPNDSGYITFHSTNRIELARLLTKIGVTNGMEAKK